MGQRFHKDSLRPTWAALIVELNGRRLEHHKEGNAWFIEGHLPHDDAPTKRIHRLTVESMLRAGVLVEEPDRFDMARLLKVVQ